MRRINQMTDVLLIARRALLASRPLRPHRTDLAMHLRAVEEIDHTLSDPGYRTGRDFPSVQAASEHSTLQAEYQADLEDERALGADGWIGHLDANH
jgi:hypothetical protein